LTAPNRFDRSVIAIAPWRSATAAATMSLTRNVESTTENSVWVRR
jgi:hypothetical protein